MFEANGHRVLNRKPAGQYPQVSGITKTTHVRRLPGGIDRMKRITYSRQAGVFRRLICLVAVLCSLAVQPAHAQLANSCWPKFRMNLANTGQGLYGGTGSDLTWTYTAGGPIRSAPVIGVDGTTYFACDDGRLYAIGGDGIKRWDFYCNCQGTASPTIAADGTIYIGSADKYLYAIRSNGTLKWKKGFAARIKSSVSLSSDGLAIYFGCTDGKFYAISSLDGSQRWVYTAGGAISSSPALGPDGAIYFGCEDGSVYALNSNGTLKWRFSPAGSGAFTASPALGPDGTVYIGSLGGFFYAVRANGTQKWRINAGGAVLSSAAVTPAGNVYFGSQDRKLHAVSSTGIELWTFTTGHYVDSSPALGVDGGIYVGSLDGKLYSLNPDGTERWHYDAGSAISSSPAIGPAGALFVGADNGTLYCFAADDTPPTAPIVTDDGAYTSQLDRIHASWSASDAESGIFSYEYCIGTSPESDDVAPWMNVGSATQHTRTGLALIDKQTYYVTVRAINGAGLTGPNGWSDGIIADATPPTAPTVIDGGRFTSDASSLSASWTAADPESGVVGYQYSIGTSPGATNIVGWTDAGSATSVTRTGLSLSGGTTYYFNVKAQNGGGAWGPVGSSDGITVDVTPPGTPVVTDAGQFFSTPNSIWASWSAIDNESGISKFEYSVGTTAGGTQVLNWTNAGVNTQATISGLSLTNGTTYYVNVRATNGALLVSAAGSSDGITLDTTPPATPVVTDDGDFTASLTQLHATWSASDAESGIKSYKYAIGTSPGATNVVGWTNAGTALEVTHTGLSLLDKQTYYFSVIATNGANAESAVGTSNGITVDATPPTRPIVTDDGAFTANPSELHATWDAEDPESGLLKFEYSIGTSPGATDVVPWTDAGLNRSVTRTGLQLQDGRTYYFNVRAYNRVNVVSQVGSSDGITVDIQSPPAPQVTDDGQFTTSGSSLHATWTSVQSPSGIAQYEYAIGTSAGGTDVRGWTSVGLVLEYTATGLNLQNDSTYYFSVRARNTLGKAGAAGSSDGIKVDLTPPPAPTVNDGGAWCASATHLTANWTCTDPESGIAEYKYAVGTTPHGTQVLNWTSAGTNTSANIGPLALVDGVTYYISVKAVNGAGVTGSDGTTDGITIDLTPPTTPMVTDDGNYTTDGTQLHAKWSAADPQSGIVLYEYSIGTSCGATDMLGWTPAETSTEATITGLTLQSGIRYFINVRATNGAGTTSQVGCSDGIFVESTPPTTPVVTDEGAYTQSTTTLRASWTSEDPETGIARFEYSIGTQPAGTDVVDWTDVGTQTSIERTNLNLSHGVTYYINVRAVNGIGLVSEIGSSDGITVDTTPPGLPTVNDGNFSSSATELRVTLDCTDQESGIAFFECAVGTSPGANNVANWTNVGPGPNIIITGLALTHGSKYYVSARAVNGAGITGPTATSDGVIIDTTGPVNVRVWDDGQFTYPADRLHGRWAASDPESGIAAFRYCIGTAPGLNDVADWLDVGAATEHTREGLALASGVTYYITVIAINGGGAESEPVSSDGIRVDLTPPSKPSVTDTGQYWGYKTSIYGSWQSEDPESGIAEYMVSVGTSPGATDVADWLSVGSNTSYTRKGLQLTDGVIYYINVKARNGAGQWSEVGSSDGVMIDSTPPTTPVVIDDGDTQAMLDMLHATWSSSDPESGIAEYMYCIGTSPGATDVVPWTSAGLAQEVTVTGLNLDPVLRYYFSVKARSNSGAWSAVSASDGIGYSSGSAIWARFRNDTRNMGRALFNATRISELGWTVSTQGYVESSPAIAADGTTYIGSGDGRIYAITQNGTLRWAYDAGSPIDSSPAIAPNRNIIVGCDGGTILCLNPAGELVWSYQTGGPIRSCALITTGEAHPNGLPLGEPTNGRVYVGSLDGFLYALDLETGTRLWRFATGGPIKSSAAAGDDGVVYFGSGDSYLYAVNPNGTLRWRFLTGSATDASPAVGSDGTIYFGSGDGHFYAVNPNGTLKWKLSTWFVADSSAAIGPDGNLYFGTGVDGGDGRLYAVRPDGSIIWQKNLPGGGIVSSPAVDPAGTIYVGACNHKMYAFNPDGSICWTFSTQSSVVSSPAVGADSSVVFGSYDGNVYCLRDITSKDLTPPTTPVVTVPTQTIAPGQPIVASWSAQDPESMVAEYTYAVGTAPGLADVTGWISAGIETSMSRDDLILEEGRTYYVSVKARNPSQRWSDIGVSPGITVSGVGLLNSIGELKSKPNGFAASLADKIVTAVFEDCFFIAEPTRITGIRCVKSGAELQPGDRVTVTGILEQVNGEKVLANTEYANVVPGEPLAPIGIMGRIFSGTGPDPFGLYATVCGAVTAVGTNYIVIDVGSGLQSARGVSGLEVRCNNPQAAIGNYVRAVGVLCKEPVNSENAPVLRAVECSVLRN